MQKHLVVSLEDIRNFSESRTIVIIDGGVYDLTDFVNLHPGGLEVLKRFDRRDASKAFHKSRHSIEAMRMLPKYCIGILEGKEEEFSEQSRKILQENSAKGAIRKKLMTHEDKFHVHKILGSLVMGHFVVRSGLLFVGAIVYLLNNDLSIFSLNLALTPAWLLISMALVHGVLSLSGLFFHVPKKSNQSKPMIHGLFRAHSISFAMRAVVCMLLCVVIQDHPLLLMFLLSLVVFTCLVGADVITEKMSVKDDSYFTTASMPYWFACSLTRQRVHKFLYGYAQFLATYVCLLGGYAGAFFTLPAIQGAAFLMTLVRKNIISAYVYHNVYMALLFFPIPFAFIFFEANWLIFGLSITLLLYTFRTLGVNKYLLWVPVLLLVNNGLIPELHRTLYINSVALVSLLFIFINLFYCLVFRKKRIDKNNRIISSKELEEGVYEIVIRTKLKMNILPGQQVLIRYDDDNEKRYTPVWSKSLDDTDQSLICLQVKNYEGVFAEPTIDPLVECPAGTVLDLHGPVETDDPVLVKVEAKAEPEPV